MPAFSKARGTRKSRPMAMIEIEGLTKKFGPMTAVAGLDPEFPALPAAREVGQEIE